MPRKELLVMGFRHAKVVKNCLKQRRAAELLALRKLHATGTAPKAAATQTSKAGQASGQPGTAGKAATRNKADAGGPSFAASALTAAASQASGKPGLSLLKSAAATAVRATSASPSFAALPFFGKNTAAAAAKAGASAAAKVTPAAAVGPRPIPAEVRANPLYRFAKLAEPQQPAATSTSARATSQTAGGQAQGALLQYAKLGAAPAAKKAASKLSDAAALLKYAKLK